MAVYFKSSDVKTAPLSHFFKFSFSWAGNIFSSSERKNIFSSSESVYQYEKALHKQFWGSPIYDHII